MHHSSLHYFPIPLGYLGLLGLLVAVAIALIEIHIVQYAFERMGIHRRWFFTLLVLSLLGSYVNLPVAELPAEQVVAPQVVYVFGVPHIVPRVETWRGTVIAINVGGAIIPLLLSIHLLNKNQLWGRGIPAIALVAVAVHALATPVRGVGIAVPTLAPPLVSVAVALLLGGARAAPLAYAAGSLGTLVGADLLNLGAVQGLGAPVASIGGAGTFDGIFVTGVLAAVLAGWSIGRPREPEGGAHPG